MLTAIIELVAAVKLLQAGAAKSPEDLLIIDPAGGFGGTWYWNRYPGMYQEQNQCVSFDRDTDS